MEKRIEEYLISKGYQVEIILGKIVTIHSYKEKKYKVRGELGDNFPLTLPDLILLERDKFKRLAHVTWQKDENVGLICTGVSESRSIDFESPELVYEKCLIKGIETMERILGNTESNKREIIKEFNAHWRDLGNKRILSFVEPTEQVKLIRTAKTKEKEFYLIDYDYEMNDEYNFLKSVENKHQIVGKGIYIHLEKGLLPPTPEESLKKWWKKVLSEFPSMTRELREVIGKKKSKEFWIVGSIKVEDKLSWFVLRFQNKQRTPFPIRKKDDFNSWELKAYDIELHNKEYILPRGGAIKSKLKKKILLVGCGSVGGEIADNIASSGLVETITLVDHDKMGIENIYRHNLGGKYLGTDKIRALKKELEMKYPYLKVKYNYNRSENYLKKCANDKFLNEFDGVIVATGDSTAERYFNEILLRKAKRPWVIYSWLEGQGVGGHAVYVHNEGRGCLTCLYRNASGVKSLNSIQNFLVGGQDVAIDISGCGTNFLPYSNLDAKETALLTSRLALKALTNQLEESKKISWKGVLDENINLKTSKRYRDPRENCLKLMALYWKGCDICND